MLWSIRASIPIGPFPANISRVPMTGAKLPQARTRGLLACGQCFSFSARAHRPPLLVDHARQLPLRGTSHPRQFSPSPHLRGLPPDIPPKDGVASLFDELKNQNQRYCLQSSDSRTRVQVLHTATMRRALPRFSAGDRSALDAPTSRTCGRESRGRGFRAERNPRKSHRV